MVTFKNNKKDWVDRLDDKMNYRFSKIKEATKRIEEKTKDIESRTNKTQKTKKPYKMKFRGFKEVKITRPHSFDRHLF